MGFWAAILRNPVLANLTFVLVLAVGALSYVQMPRQQDPSVNFNWVNIFTYLPGATAEDVEKQVTDIIEDAVDNVADIRFSMSRTRTGASTVLMRFQEIDDYTFDKRVTDLRREVQSRINQLPAAATEPYILEITSSNGFPTAMIVVHSNDSGEVLHQQAHDIEKQLKSMAAIDSIHLTGWREPQLMVHFYPEKLTEFGLNPQDVIATVRANFRDVAAGEYNVAGNHFMVRIEGAKVAPEYLAKLPIITKLGEIPLGRVAAVELLREDPNELVRFEGQNGVMLSISKKANANMLTLVHDLQQYIQETNQRLAPTGVTLTLVDDQTQKTREALGVMQTNAIYGLLLVLLTSWLFLGARIAFLTSIGIPFILAGTFIMLKMTGETLNIVVLLGVVISLGMLVDDAVVVVETIYYRLQRGEAPLQAATNSLKEVAVPVTAAVLTTCAAFLPLMLIEGVIGKFMRVIPMVVSASLLISLIEAFWILPSHTLMTANQRRQSRAAQLRERFLHWLRIKYTKILTKLMRRPVLSLLTMIVVLMTPVIGGFAAGKIKVDFFANDPQQIFYVNITMPAGKELADTAKVVKEISQQVKDNLRQGEARSVVDFAGSMHTDVTVLSGDQYGQVLVSLNPHLPGMRTVGEIMNDMRAAVTSVPGPENLYFFNVKGGPPATKPVEIKVIGNNFAKIQAAMADLEQLLKQQNYLHDIELEEQSLQHEVNIELDQAAIKRAKLDPATVSDSVRLLIDGQVVGRTRYLGDELKIYVKAKPEPSEDLERLLDFNLTNPIGERVPLRSLVRLESKENIAYVSHYKLQRSLTIKADIDKELTNERDANDRIKAAWAQFAPKHPDIKLDFSGLLDDLEEAIDGLKFFFLIGIGLIYLILGTQFKSYYQPLMILATVPMAFCGVALGLLFSGNPLSLVGMYGVVALAGIAVNSAIVLISAANDRLAAGMSVNHAIIYAARRRLVPILITALTTIAGLFSLATGMGGKSLIWGPVANAIVWGLAISTVLTLFMIPLLYRSFMSNSAKRHAD